MISLLDSEVFGDLFGVDERVHDRLSGAVEHGPFDAHALAAGPIVGQDVLRLRRQAHTEKRTDRLGRRLARRRHHRVSIGVWCRPRSTMSNR